jgi:hypothetical protein
MVEKIYEWNQIQEGDFIRVSWEEAKYVENHWTIKPQFLVAKIIEKTFRHLDCEVYFPSDKEFYRDVIDLMVKKGNVELNIRNKIVIPRSAFTHLTWSKKKRMDALIRDKEPLVYTKVQKLKPSDVLIYEI